MPQLVHDLVAEGEAALAPRAAGPVLHWSETAGRDDPRWRILREARAKTLLIPVGWR